MPLWEYLCADCGAREEKLRSLADRDRGFPCPHCEAGRMRRVLVQPTGFALKGKGWARDHYGLKDATKTS